MALILDGTSGLSGVDGGAATPAIRGGDADTGEFFPAAGSIAWATNGSERMRIDSSGNVGIGTTSPSSALDVNGAIEALGTLGASTPAYAFSNYQDAGMFRPTAAGSAVAFSTSATERMRIDSSGNVGIGTASPARKLDVNGIIACNTNIRVTHTANPYLYLNDGTATSYVQVASSALDLTVGGANPITFTANSGERMRIDSSGNVGIGTASPTQALTVSGAVGWNAPVTNTNATYVVAATDNWIIANRAGTVTLTLPTASSYTGRIITVKNIQAQTVVSDASNVKPIGSNTAGTAILAATAGKFATLVSDGTNWIIMQAN